MSETFYLPREQQAELAELLDQVPFLVEQLAITITRQDRLGAGPRISRGKTAQPLPYNVGASNAADALHDELAGWVRRVCEQRNLTYGSRNDTISLARWLRRWIIALALTEGADTALIDIEAVILDARHAIDRPAERPRSQPDQCEIAEADRMVLNASAASRLAKSIGYQTLTVRRIKYLRESGRITPIPTAGRSLVFLFGDIRKAHIESAEEEPVAS